MSLESVRPIRKILTSVVRSRLPCGERVQCCAGVDGEADTATTRLKVCNQINITYKPSYIRGPVLACPVFSVTLTSMAFLTRERVIEICWYQPERAFGHLSVWLLYQLYAEFYAFQDVIIGFYVAIALLSSLFSSQVCITQTISLVRNIFKPLSYMQVRMSKAKVPTYCLHNFFSDVYS